MKKLTVIYFAAIKILQANNYLYERNRSRYLTPEMYTNAFFWTFIITLILLIIAFIFRVKFALEEIKVEAEVEKNKKAFLDRDSNFDRVSFFNQVKSFYLELQIAINNKNINHLEAKIDKVYYRVLREKLTYLDIGSIDNKLEKVEVLGIDDYTYIDRARYNLAVVKLEANKSDNSERDKTEDIYLKFIKGKNEENWLLKELLTSSNTVDRELLGKSEVYELLAKNRINPEDIHNIAELYLYQVLNASLDSGDSLDGFRDNIIKYVNENETMKDYGGFSTIDIELDKYRDLQDKFQIRVIIHGSIRKVLQGRSRLDKESIDAFFYLTLEGLKKDKTTWVLKSFRESIISEK